MSKTIKQLTETSTLKTGDLLHVVDVTNDQDKKITAANLLNSRAYGETYADGNNFATTISVADTWYDITNSSAWTTSNGLANKFTQDTTDGSLTYIGEEDIIVRVNLSGSMTVVFGGAVSDIRLGVDLNGAVDPKSILQSDVDVTAVNTPYSNLAGSFLLALSKDDVIKPQVKNKALTHNVNIVRYNFNVSL